MTLKQARESAIKNARKTGMNQIIILKDNDYIPFARSDGTLHTCERLVKALGAEIVDEITVLK